ncbi:hypothetical protein B0H21DRAFT_759613 [Amylocystis lapponica]|nr:hypothetical protein B0H21DRAFT_759613 [Amylocystis lapponica]
MGLMCAIVPQTMSVCKDAEVQCMEMLTASEAHNCQQHATYPTHSGIQGGRAEALWCMCSSCDATKSMLLPLLFHVRTPMRAHIPQHPSTFISEAPHPPCGRHDHHRPWARDDQARCPQSVPLSYTVPSRGWLPSWLGSEAGVGDGAGSHVQGAGRGGDSVFGKDESKGTRPRWMNAGACVWREHAYTYAAVRFTIPILPSHLPFPPSRHSFCLLDISVTVFVYLDIHGSYWLV